MLLPFACRSTLTSAVLSVTILNDCQGYLDVVGHEDNGSPGSIDGLESPSSSPNRGRQHHHLYSWELDLDAHSLDFALQPCPFDVKGKSPGRSRIHCPIPNQHSPSRVLLLPIPRYMQAQPGQTVFGIGSTDISGPGFETRPAVPTPTPPRHRDSARASSTKHDRKFVGNWPQSIEEYERPH